MAKKEKTLKQLKKDLWKVFSIYVRMRDGGVCFSCRKKIPNYYDRQGNLKPGWKAAQAGHWITAANCGIALYFHEKNVHCQCHRCNINLSGNWLEYEFWMIKTYGKGICEELKSMKWKGQVEFTHEEYKEKIKYYKNIIESASHGGSIKRDEPLPTL